MATSANLSIGGGDPRDPIHATTKNEPVALKPRLTHDPNVSFEEYVYYAAITRAEEKIANQQHLAAVGPRTFKSTFKNRFSKGVVYDSPTSGSLHETEKTSSSMDLSQSSSAATDIEWKRASRAIRTAGWSSVFYLITTDILGPFSVPYVDIKSFGYMIC